MLSDSVARHRTFAMAMWLALLAIGAANTDVAQSTAVATSTGVDDHLLSGTSRLRASETIPPLFSRALGSRRRRPTLRPAPPLPVAHISSALWRHPMAMRSAFVRARLPPRTCRQSGLNSCWAFRVFAVGGNLSANPSPFLFRTPCAHPCWSHRQLQAEARATM